MHLSKTQPTSGSSGCNWNMEWGFWINHILNISCALCWFPCKYIQKPRRVYLTPVSTIRIANVLNVGLQTVLTVVYKAEFPFPWEKEYFSPLQEASKHNVWFPDTRGRSRVYFQLPGSKWILPKTRTLFFFPSKFLEDFSGPNTSLGISHSVWLSLLGRQWGQEVGEGTGWGTVWSRMEV